MVGFANNAAFALEEGRVFSSEHRKMNGHSALMLERLNGAAATRSNLGRNH
jgi:hypothetical protein